MKAMDPRILMTGLLLVLTLALGFWLSSAGKPYNAVLFNVHKVMALAAVIAMIVTINHLRTGVPIEGVALSAIVLSGLLFLGLFASGALLSIGRPDHAAILIVHSVAPLLAIVSAAAAIFLLARRLAVT